MVYIQRDKKSGMNCIPTFNRKWAWMSPNFLESSNISKRLPLPPSSFLVESIPLQDRNAGFFILSYLKILVIRKIGNVEWNVAWFMRHLRPFSTWSGLHDFDKLFHISHLLIEHFWLKLPFFTLLEIYKSSSANHF